MPHHTLTISYHHVPSSFELPLQTIVIFSLHPNPSLLLNTTNDSIQSSIIERKLYPIPLTAFPSHHHLHLHSNPEAQTHHNSAHLQTPDLPQTRIRMPQPIASKHQPRIDPQPRTTSLSLLRQIRANTNQIHMPYEPKSRHQREARTNPDLNSDPPRTVATTNGRHLQIHSHCTNQDVTRLLPTIFTPQTNIKRCRILSPPNPSTPNSPIRYFLYTLI